MHPATLPPESLLEECRLQRLRRSGPGGQRRNKVETGVRLLHRPTGVAAEATERRSHAQNLRVATTRLRVNLALQIRSPPSPDQAPSPTWQARCRGGRIGVRTSHNDFPAILAEALDCIALHNGDLKPAAEALDCTASQLVKLLKKEPRALALANRWRSQQGQSRLQ